MFLRSNKRLKDGKEHRYWSVVENKRIAANRTVQKTIFYLGEIPATDGRTLSTKRHTKPEKIR